MRSWDIIHRWSSLICSLTLLIACFTGLPLIFHDEIESLTNRHSTIVEMSTSRAPTDLDLIVENALNHRPNQVIQYVGFDNEDPIISIATGPSTDANPKLTQFDFYDARTATRIDAPSITEGVMWFLLQLHKDLFIGLSGTLFIGAMGLFFLLSLISGVVLYAPFMRKLDFAEIRSGRVKRHKWLDLHNLLGIVTFAWALVVGITGVINTLSTPIAALWQANQLAEMTAPYQNMQAATHLSSLNEAIVVAQEAAPNMEPSIIAFPGTPYSSKHHYAVFMSGKTPLTSRLLTPALIDAETGELTAMRSMPWYVSLVFISQPLHFGDYGGLPLKIIWALLDIITIIVLISGLYLWLIRQRNPALTNSL